MTKKKSSKTRNKIQPTKFTQKGVEKLRGEATGRRIADATVTGLSLYVGTSGHKSWYIIYRDRGNKRQSYRFGSLKQYNVIEARAEARILLGKIAGGENIAVERREKKQRKAVSKARTLRKYLEGDYWRKHLKRQKSGKATKKRIESAFKRFLDLDMAEITSAALVDHRDERQDDGVKPQTLNRDRLALHALFEKAIVADLIDINPARKDKKAFPPLETVDDERVRFLGQRDENENFEKGERTRFMTALKTMPLNIQTLVGLAMNTGCRRGELFSLTWDRISMKNHTLTLDATTTKTKKKRTIPLNSKALAMLETWRTKKGENVTHISGLVFPSEVTGKRMDNIKRSWTTLVTKAQVENFRFHDLRHDFASRLVLAGIPLIEVRDLLGHSSIEMTERYAHVNGEQLRSAVEVL